MTPCLLTRIGAESPTLHEHRAAVESAGTFDELIEAAERLMQDVGRLVLEAEMVKRASEPTTWPACPRCGRRLHSKGWAARELMTSLGRVRWRRRIGRCPGRCHGSESAPLDEDLRLAPHQRHSAELKRRATVLAVFVSLATASEIMERLTLVRVGASTVWRWVQEAGQRAATRLEAELAQCGDGEDVRRETMEAVFDRLLMPIGADGVMVPFRPNGGSPTGAIVWREVKVGVIARLERVVNRAGRRVTRLRQRRLVAVLGSVDDLAARLRLEARRQGLASAPRVVWVSDGARGFWRIFHEHLAPLNVVGVLDFYHAAGHLWTAAETWCFRYMPSAHLWFDLARHELRHGKVADLIAEIRDAANAVYTSRRRRKILHRVANYLDRHRSHLDFETFRADGYPLGSGFVESAVKWLIQQRFKGVGMRWSQSGFNHLLMLRLAWTNDRFDALFLPELLNAPLGSSTAGPKSNLTPVPPSDVCVCEEVVVEPDSEVSSGVGAAEQPTCTVPTNNDSAMGAVSFGSLMLTRTSRGPGLPYTRQRFQQRAV